MACDTSAMPKLANETCDGNTTEQLHRFCESRYIHTVQTYAHRESGTLADVDTFKFVGRQGHLLDMEREDVRNVPTSVLGMARRDSGSDGEIKDGNMGERETNVPTINEGVHNSKVPQEKNSAAVVGTIIPTIILDVFDGRSNAIRTMTRILITHKMLWIHSGVSLLRSTTWKSVQSKCVQLLRMMEGELATTQVNLLRKARPWTSQGVERSVDASKASRPCPLYLVTWRRTERCMEKGGVSQNVHVWIVISVR